MYVIFLTLLWKVALNHRGFWWKAPEFDLMSAEVIPLFNYSKNRLCIKEKRACVLVNDCEFTVFAKKKKKCLQKIEENVWKVINFSIMLS